MNRKHTHSYDLISNKVTLTGYYIFSKLIPEKKQK